MHGRLKSYKHTIETKRNAVSSALPSFSRIAVSDLASVYENVAESLTML